MVGATRGSSLSFCRIVIIFICSQLSPGINQLTTTCETDTNNLQLRRKEATFSFLQEERSSTFIVEWRQLPLAENRSSGRW